MLYTRNRDVPGVIGALGMTLGDLGVNIANFTLGRTPARQDAIAILYLDEALGFMRTYAIGDVHGHLDKLQALHTLIAADRATTDDEEAPVIHIGDLVDRGPDSRGVIDFLLAGTARGENWLVLKGNHDRMFSGFMADADYHDPRLRRDLWWLHDRLGGVETLASYGVMNAGERLLHDVQAEARAKVPASHLAYLAALPTHHLRDTCLFVHAGVRPGVEWSLAMS
jgi:serine/threonine protein phosphatase 1